MKLTIIIIINKESKNYLIQLNYLMRTLTNIINAKLFLIFNYTYKSILNSKKLNYIIKFL